MSNTTVSLLQLHAGSNFFSGVFIQLCSQLQIERQGKKRKEPLLWVEVKCCHAITWNVADRHQQWKNTIKTSVAGIVPHIMCPHMLSISVLCGINRLSIHRGSVICAGNALYVVNSCLLMHSKCFALALFPKQVSLYLTLKSSTPAMYLHSLSVPSFFFLRMFP